MPTTTTAETVTLVNKWIGFALALAARWGRRYPWLADDLASAATFALWRCAQQFAGRGSFGGMVRLAVGRACISRLRTERARNVAAFRRAGPEITDRGEETGAEDLLADDAPTPAEVAELAEEAAKLPELLKVLPKKERAEVEAYYLNGMTHAEIGKGCGSNRSVLSRRIARSVGELRIAAGR